jgi:hypothetical protein
LEGFTQTKISTLAVKDNFLVAGGFQGELTCKVSHVLAAIHVDGSRFFFFFFFFGCYAGDEMFI